MAGTHEATPRATPPAPQPEQDQSQQAVSPKIWQIILIGVVAIIFTAVWLGLYQALDKTIWSNAFVAAHRWAIPLGVMLFSLLVGLAQKYLRAPTVIHGGGLADSMKGEEKVDYSTFWGALVSSYGSLLSGASVGPEGPLGILVQDIAAWTQEKLKIERETALGFRVAALASAYNGIIGSPLFTGVFATEFQVGGSTALLYMTWNLLAGVIGFFIYTLLHLHVFAQYIPFTPIQGLSLTYLLFAIGLGIVGAALAIFTGAAFQIFGALIERTLRDRVVWRALAAGAVIAIVVSFVPAVMFAGETQIFPMIHNPASYGVLVLLGLGMLKLVLLAFSFKSGYLGGPTFPVLFACTMVGLAFGLLFPGVPISIFVLCIEAGAFTLLLQAPLTVILLVAVIGTADSYTVALLVVSSVVALIIGGGVKRLRARRTQQAAMTSQRRAAAIS